MMSRTLLASLLNGLLVASSVGANNFGNRCRVTNHDHSGPGSLRECMLEAHEAAAPVDFKITIAKELEGATIDAIDGEGGCGFTVGNAEAGTGVGKSVTIKGPKTEGAHVEINALFEECVNSIVFLFSTDVSVHMSNINIQGGNIGIDVAGTSSRDDPVPESVTLESVTIGPRGPFLFGVLLLDIVDVHINDCTISGCGSDGLRYEQFYGISTSASGYEIGITNSHFIGNGQSDSKGDGADIRVELNFGITTIKGSTFDDNEDDGIDIEAEGFEGTRNSEVFVRNSHFNFNGDNGFKSVGVDVEKFVKSECDENGDDGLEIEDAHLNYAFASKFDGNGDDGLELKEATAVEIKLCEFKNNGDYGIQLDVTLEGTKSTIDNLIKSSLTGNGDGAIDCELEEGGTRDSGDGGDSASVGRTYKDGGK